MSHAPRHKRPRLSEPREIHIRDPIHGTIEVSAREIKLVDHPIFQRLRNIKQLGFADLAFPGATHSRYSHSLGAMHIASRVFDRLFAHNELPDRVRARFRQAVRLAMLFHDVGHAPLSHTTETLMPPVGELGLGLFAGNDVGRIATHEDYTLKMVLDSPLGERIEAIFGDAGIAPRDVAELIVGVRFNQPSTRFRHGGTDYAPILRQIVSSECDADRMDYLMRDSFYSGVNYGKFDADWLIDNVVPVEKNDGVFLGIRSRAVFSFEDFLLSRYHMFATVYLHFTPVIFERMLGRFFGESDEFDLPSDIERYAKLDDMDLWLTLRKSKNRWARRITERRPYVLLDEAPASSMGHHESEVDQDELVQTLESADIDVIHTKSQSVLSKYFAGPVPARRAQGSNPIYVVGGGGETVALERYTALYARYESPALLHRVYVEPDARARARQILAAVKASGPEPNVRAAEA